VEIDKMGSNRNIPSDKINLRLILVSGKTKEFLFSPNDSAGDIAQHVFDSWPEGNVFIPLDSFPCNGTSEYGLSVCI